MEDRELTQYIIDNLSKSQDQNDLILEICNRTGKNWPEAQALVEKVRSDNSGTIARRQAPFLTAIALILFIAGAGMMLYEGYTLAETIGIFLPNGDDPMTLVGLLFVIFSSAPGTIGIFILGLAMTLGSLIGMSEVWRGLLFPDQQ
jgi:hypothetical protein